MQNIIELLEERGFLDSITGDELRTHAKEPLKVYCGFDPTGDSLHLGNLVAVMGLAWFQKLGHTPYAIVGGATGMIGDPSGKAKERQLLGPDAIEKNVRGIERDLRKILTFDEGDNPAILLNNYEWFKEMTVVDFLRNVGKMFRMGPMLGKESVRARLNSEEGMSFTEFSYQLLQGYDFLYLYDQYGVEVQFGGSDQWGNILAGTDLIRKERGASAHGLTFPLLTKEDGTKFGKSESGAIWLAEEKLSPYEFYQYLYRVADADVIKLMRMLTFMEMDEIRRIEASMQQEAYIPNTAQKRLAEEVTCIVHGEEKLTVAQRVTEAAAPGAKTALDVDVLEELAADMPSYTLSLNDIVDAKLVEIIVKLGLLGSKGEARRIIRNGGLYLNNTRVQDEQQVIGKSDLVGGRLLLLAIGKKNKALLRLAD